MSAGTVITRTLSQSPLIAVVLYLAVLVSLVYAACIPLVVSAMDLEQPGPAIALTAFIGLAFLQPIALGVLQGMERFAAFGFMQLAIAVSRIALGVPWVLAGGGALTRGLDRFVSEHTGLPARVSADALEAVAKGALICLEHLGEWHGILESSDADP